MFQQAKFPTLLSLWIFTFALLIIAFRSSIDELLLLWNAKEEYSHGYFIPAISAYLIWLKHDELNWSLNKRSSIIGLSILFVGLILDLLGNLATIRTVEHYSFVIAIIGLFTIAFGTSGLKTALVPLTFLFFMIPFPEFFLSNLSSKLQLWSSWIGVEFIRACDIMVYLEGNVIDLGGYKLQVVDACSGLRYLFPLASLSFLCAYLFKAPFWQKVIIFLSSMPLTIFMNSFRIGVIGILVNRWGTDMAEGFLHDFEGWVVFLMCMALLFVEMWCFARFNGVKTAFADLVVLPEPVKNSGHSLLSSFVLNKSVYSALALIAVIGFSVEFVRGGEDIIPHRKIFQIFPMEIGQWKGQREYMEQQYLNQLRLTDYIIANYHTPSDNTSINFYTAYYQAQRKGVAVHSPKTCIPGNGWIMSQLSQMEIPGIQFEGTPLRVNRAIIEKDESRQLVYYWFQQRGRLITNEYLVKWYLFLDAITMHRTDGSLVRVVIPIEKGKDPESADQRLQAFLKDLQNPLPEFIPGTRATPQ